MWIQNITHAHVRILVTQVPIAKWHFAPTLVDVVLETASPLMCVIAPILGLTEQTAQPPSVTFLVGMESVVGPTRAHVMLDGLEPTAPLQRTNAPVLTLLVTVEPIAPTCLQLKGATIALLALLPSVEELPTLIGPYLLTGQQSL